MTLLDRFYQRVDKHPDKIAIEENGSQLTYSFLSRKVNSLSALMRESGVTSEDHLS